MATLRSSSGSYAAYTWPRPPAPTRDIKMYRPAVVPTGSVSSLSSAASPVAATATFEGVAPTVATALLGDFLACPLLVGTLSASSSGGSGVESRGGATRQCYHETALG